MAAKKFDFQFEDLGRRPDSLVNSAGFGDMIEDPENPDEGFVDVDLDVEEADEAISAVPKEDREAKPNGKPPEGERDAKKDARRKALRRRRESREIAHEAINEARKEVAGELNELHTKIDELQGQNELQEAEQEYATEKERIEAAMTKAMEDGNSEEYAGLNSQLIELNTKLSEKRMKLERPHRPDTPQDLDTGAEPGDDQPAAPRAKEFILANESWWIDPDHEDAVEYVRDLDKKLVGMGHDPRGERYWAILHHNFDKKFPGLRKDADDDLDLDLDLNDDPPKDEGGNRSPVARPGAGGGASQGGRRTTTNNDDPPKGNKVRLNAMQKQNMIRFGLDPTNPEHLRQYAMNVQQD